MTFRYYVKLGQDFHTQLYGLMDIMKYQGIWSTRMLNSVKYRDKDKYMKEYFRVSKLFIHEMKKANVDYNNQDSLDMEKIKKAVHDTLDKNIVLSKKKRKKIEEHTVKERRELGECVVKVPKNRIDRTALEVNVKKVLQERYDNCLEGNKWIYVGYNKNIKESIVIDIKKEFFRTYQSIWYTNTRTFTFTPKDKNFQTEFDEHLNKIKSGGAVVVDSIPGYYMNRIVVKLTKRVDSVSALLLKTLMLNKKFRYLFKIINVIPDAKYYMDISQ